MIPTRSNTDRPIAIVTGAARRVGRAIAAKLATAGCDLILTYHTSQSDADEADRELKALGASTAWIQLDIGDLDRLEARAQEIVKLASRADILIHNASIYGPTPLQSLTPDQLLKHYSVNAAGPALLTKHLASLLSASKLPGGGAVIAMGDMHVLGRPRSEFSAYSMSKAALHELILTLARELAPRVRVNAVAPGVVAFPEEESDPAMRAAYAKRVPLARIGTPEDAAEVVRWLALNAHYVTGEIIRIDGGRWLA